MRTGSARRSETERTFYVGSVSASLMLSGIFIFGHRSVSGDAPIRIASERYVLASALFGVLFLVGFIKAAPVNGRTFLRLAGASFLGVFLYNVLFFNGLDMASASSGGLMIATIPVWTALFERLFLRVRLSARKLVGTILSFSGVAFLFLAALRPEAGQRGPNELLGGVLYLSAAISFALYTILMKKIVNTMDPRTTTFYSTALGTVMLVAWGVVTNGDLPLSRSIFSIPILYMALFGTVGAFLLWFRSVKHLGPARASVFLNLVPLFTVLLAKVFLDETLDFSVVLSLAVIVAGVLIVQSDRAMVASDDVAQGPSIGVLRRRKVQSESKGLRAGW